MRADFELTWAKIADQEKRLDGRIDKVEGSFEALEAKFGQMETTVTELHANITQMQAAVTGAHAALVVLRGDVRNLGESVRETYRLLRQTEERFDCLGLVDDEKVSRSELEALEARVRALEERKPPAA